jgi:hypothetical protein
MRFLHSRIAALLVVQAQHYAIYQSSAGKETGDQEKR